MAYVEAAMSQAARPTFRFTAVHASAKHRPDFTASWSLSRYRNRWRGAHWNRHSSFNRLGKTLAHINQRNHNGCQQNSMITRLKAHTNHLS